MYILLGSNHATFFLERKRKKFFILLQKFNTNLFSIDQFIIEKQQLITIKKSMKQQYF